MISCHISSIVAKYKAYMTTIVITDTAHGDIMPHMATIASLYRTFVDMISYMATNVIIDTLCQTISVAKMVIISPFMQVHAYCTGTHDKDLV